MLSELGHASSLALGHWGSWFPGFQITGFQGFSAHRQQIVGLLSRNTRVSQSPNKCPHI